MSKNKEKSITPINEIIAQLKKPATMSHVSYTVFVEGKDDVIIYREIARKRSIESCFTFEQREGRNTLFTDFNTLNQHQSLIDKTLFFADQDTFVFQGIPTQYQEIHFTNGYSIENDLFEDGTEFLMTELSPDEKNRFDVLINSVSEWFAFEVNLILTGRNTNTKIDINGLNPNIITPNSNHITSSFLVERNYEPASTELTEQIKSNYTTLLRGKVLFEVLLRIARDRDSIAVKDKYTYWSVCITEGLRKASASNINRILNIFDTKAGLA